MIEIPKIAFYCTDCFSFNLQVRPVPVNSKWFPVEDDARPWHHPNKGRERFDVDPKEDDLEGLCLDCNCTDWDAIKKGNIWWNDFLEWFEKQGDITQPDPESAVRSADNKTGQ
jgi:hypothetical protein